MEQQHYNSSQNQGYYGGGEGHTEYDGERGHAEYSGDRGHTEYGAEGAYGEYAGERGHTEYSGYGYDQGYPQNYNNSPHDYHQQYARDPYNADDAATPPVYSGYPNQGYDAGNRADGKGILPSDPANYGNTFRNKEYAALHDGESERKKKPGCLDSICCCRAKWAQWCGLFCCLILLAIIIFAIVLAATFKKPSVDFLGVGPYPNASVPQYDSRNGAFDINVGLNIMITNPNIIGAKFPQIKASAFYPLVKNTKIGGGNLTDVNIPSKSVTNITFPFSINYDTKLDPNLVIVKDLLTKCKRNEKIRVDYTLVVSVKIILVTVSPSFDRSADIDCPINDNNWPDIPGIPKGSITKRGVPKRAPNIDE